MSLYSAIQFTSVSFLYASASNLGDFQVKYMGPLLSPLRLTLPQFLFIDVFLILPIAIFSKPEHPMILGFCSHNRSGMDGAFPCTMPEATNGKTRLKESSDFTTWPNGHLRIHSSCWLSGCEKTKLVSRQYSTYKSIIE